MIGSKQLTENTVGKRRLTENGATMDPSENQAKKTTAAMRSNSASFPSASVSQQQPVIFDDSMKRSVSWPGPTVEKTTMLSFDDMSDIDSYAGNILNTKFNQQNGLMLKHSVFRTQGAGVTKSLHNKACELIASAAYSYSVSSGTAMLGMQLFDRALSLTVVRKVEVTLLAATCLFLAAKLEEITPPYADELAYFCGKRFEKEEVHNMEQVLLPLFQCQIGIPTRYDFAQRFYEAGGLSAREKSLVSFLLELSYLDFNLNYFLPSKVAAGAVHLAIQMLRHGPKLCTIWSLPLQQTARCSERELVEIVLRLRLLHWNVDATPMKNIMQRYTADAHYGLAELSPLPYSQLRFDAHLLPKNERELPDYATCKEEKADVGTPRMR